MVHGDVVTKSRNILAIDALLLYGLLNQVHQYAALLRAPAGSYDQVKLLLDMHGLGNLIAGIG